MAPAVLLPGGLDRFTLPKLAVALFGAAALLAPSGPRLPRRYAVALAAGAGLCILGALFGSSPILQLLGRAPRFEGLLVGSAYLLVFLAATRLRGERDLQRTFVRCWAGTAILVAVVAGLEAVGALSLGGDRVVSLLGGASDLGGYAALSAGVLGVAALGDTRAGRLVQAGAMAAAAGVVISASRGALLGLVAVLPLVILSTGDRRKRLLVLGSACGAALLALLVPATRARLLGLSPLAASTVSGRLDVWSETWQTVRSQPLGLGPNGFADRITAAHTLEWYRTQPTELILDSPHNLVLQLWSAGGPALVALAAVGLWWLASAAWAAYRSPTGDVLARAGAAGLLSYLVVLQTHFTGPTTTPIAATAAGLVVPLAAPTVPMMLPRAQAGGAAALGLLMLLGALAEIPRARAIDAVAQASPTIADGHFRTVMTLRPWAGTDIALDALHAYAVAARNENPAAGATGVKWAKETLVAQQDSALALYDAASIWEAVGDLGAADERLARAQTLDPHNPRLLQARGIVAATRGDLRLAEDWFLQATRVVPASPDPWRNLVVVYQRAGDQQRANEAQRRSEELSAAAR